ncbi:MAG: PQQ-binding-like beta-propeller repeat protein, partial [Acidobacteriota bacterium]|nr:PQQ-binding-like beta-propeller repeat protein [Acidobacteriota bacterium]
ALDIATGALTWKARLGTPITAPPVIGGQLVCVQAAGRGTFALSLKTGKIFWHARLGGSIQSCPVLDGEFVYLADDEGMVYALA